VHGEWYFPGDLGQLFPITRVASHPVAAHNALESDAYVDFGPFLHFDVQQVQAGHLPSWNPYNGNGQPFLADLQTGVFSPFSVFFYVLGFRLALLASAMARLWMLGFFTFLFIARHRVKELAAVVGGAIFAYAGYHLVWLDYQTHVSVSALLPVGLWLTRVALDHRGGDLADRRRRYLACCGLAAVVGGMVTSGHPETFAFDGPLIAAYALVALVVETRQWRETLRQIVPVAGAFAIGIGLSAVQLLPFSQYEGSSTRAAQTSANPQAVTAGFLVDTVPLMAFPNLFGGPQFHYDDVAFFQRHYPQDNYAEVDGNTTGLLALCLVPVGLFAVWRRRREALAVFSTACLVVGSITLYQRWAGALWRHVPFLGSAYLNRSQDIQLLGIALLAALAVDWLMTVVRPDGRERLSLGPVLGLTGSFVGVGGVMLVSALGLRHLVGRLPGSTATTSADMAIVHGNMTAEIAIAAAFAVAIALVCASRPRGATSVVLSLAPVVLAFASNGLIMSSYNTTVPSKLVYARTPAVKKLASVVGSSEVLFVRGVFPYPSTNLWFGFHDIGSYDAIGLRWHDDLYRRAFHVPHVYDEHMPSCPSELALFGVQWVVGGTGRFSGAPSAYLQRVANLGAIPYYRVTGSGRFALVGRSIDAPGDGSALARVSTCSFDPDSTVLLDPSSYDPGNRAPLGSATGTTLTGASVRTLSVGTTSASARTSSPRPAWLVVRETWAPGWTATVDGRPAAVHRADVAFQAVRVPAGKHLVVLRYRPSILNIGLVVTLLSLLVLFGCLLSIALWLRPTKGAHVRRSPEVQ